MVQDSVRFGIGRRISGLVSLVVAVTVLCVAGLLAAYGAQQASKMKRATIESTAYVFASAVADHIEQQGSHEIHNVLRAISRVPGIISASVHNSKGKVIASLGQKAVLKSETAANNPGLWELLLNNTVPVSVKIVKDGRIVGTLVVVTDISDLRVSFFSTMLAALTASLLAAAFGVLLSIPLQRRITQPITELTASMQQIKQSHDYSSKIAAESFGETAVMVESFNSLISDIRSRDASLQKLAYFDPLTGLSNRTNFTRILAERLEQIAGSSGSVAVVLLNIDNFHSFNDAFGHGIGDAILMNTANTIRDELMSQDFVARLGGDEFALLVDDAGNPLKVESTLARIHSAFYKPIKFSGLEFHITVAAGITILPRDSSDAGDALRHADLAVKSAKLLGHGRTVYFHTSMDASVRKNTELGQALRFAIDKGELQVHYQPQYNSIEHKVVGFEALLRWNHPKLGLVPPSIFIPLAEETGTIVAIGDWILEESCRQAQAWLQNGQGSRSIAVNVSPAQILQAGFVKKVGSILSLTNLPHHLLCLELTESMFLGRSLESVRAILDDLHEIGVMLALDDFGTGYSSLAYLSQLPFDKLKIDRSFVSGAHNSPRRTEILRAIIAMAQSLGMDVVAEGAEIPEEIELLQRLSSNEIQGYAIAEPAAAVEALLKANRIEASAALSRNGAKAQFG